MSVEDVSSSRQSKRLMLYEVAGGFGLWELPVYLQLDLPNWPEPYEESRRVAREFVEEGWFALTAQPFQSIRTIRILWTKNG